MEKSLSYRNKDFYTANKNLENDLQHKRLLERGFKFCDRDINSVSQILENKISARTNIELTTYEKGNRPLISQTGYNDKGFIFSTYGRVLEKWILRDGSMYVYSDKKHIFGQFFYFKIYVFINKNREVIKEYRVGDWF